MPDAAEGIEVQLTHWREIVNSDRERAANGSLFPQFRGRVQTDDTFSNQWLALVRKAAGR